MTLSRLSENSDFFRIFNFREDRSRGRSMLLLYQAFSCIANIFISGTFYTGFLTANGISIVRVGIIGFIPYIAWIFAPFSPKFLSRFRHRRALLLANHCFFYLCIIVATTVMPMFVSDHFMRTVWFGVFLFLGHSFNVLIGSGSTAWHINFLPDGADRHVYFSFLDLTSSLIGTTAAVAMAFLADSLAGSPKQYEIIVTMRFVSFALFLIGGLLLYLVPKEYAYPAREKPVTVHDMLTVPLRSPKFIKTAIIGSAWCIISNLNSSTWSYFILNTVGVSYVLTYVNSVACALGSIFLLRWWRGLISRYSWFKILVLSILLKAAFEFLYGFTSKDTMGIYLCAALLEGFDLVGTTLLFSNMFYVNLPRENTDVCFTFWKLIVNFSTLFGAMAGTWFISAAGSDAPLGTVFGLPLYSSQILVWIMAALLVLLALHIRRVTPEIIPDGET